MHACMQIATDRVVARKNESERETSEVLPLEPLAARSRVSGSGRRQ